MTDSSVSPDALTRARELYQRGFAKPAIDVLEVELRTHPDDGRLWRLRGIILAREGRYDEAFENIEQALVLAPLGHEGMLVLATGYARRGKASLAAAIGLELSRDPAFPLVLWESLYALLGATRQFRAALAVCRRAIRERPDDDFAHFVMAQALVRARRPAELVVAMLHKAIELNPRDARYRASLILQLLRMNRPDDAYGEVRRLPSEAVAALECRCCLQSALQLCIRQGDEARAARFAVRLAALAARPGAASQTADGGRHD